MLGLAAGAPARLAALVSRLVSVLSSLPAAACLTTRPLASRSAVKSFIRDYADRDGGTSPPLPPSPHTLKSFLVAPPALAQPRASEPKASLHLEGAPSCWQLAVRACVSNLLHRPSASLATATCE